MTHLLEINNLDVKFDTDEGRITAIDNVSLTLDQGKVLGIVGESGSGKSVTAKSIMQLNPGNTIYNDNAEIIIDDENVLKFTSKNDLKKIRGGKVSMIFQEPMASFAPAIKIGSQMVEQLMIHKPIDKNEAKNISIDMLNRVGIADAEKRFNQYAFELSGGMRQRAMIAMALSTMPKLLLADEPTTALDVTIQAQVINLMKDIIKEYNMGVIFITHDLGVIAQVADDVAVMYLGSVVEQGPVNEILKNPMHPYTKGLINALPDINNLDAPLTPIPGNIPSPLDRPSGCVFRTRCPHASKEGKEGNIEMGLVEIKPGHWLDKCGVDCGKNMSENIVSVNNLSVSFDYQENFLSKKQKIKAVNNINIKIKKGSFFGLVGESGSGKTTLGRAILGANKISNGNVIFHDDERDFDLTTINSKEMKEYRKKAQLIFQDPYAALSPRMTVRDIIAEPLEVMKITNSREETDERVRDIAAKCRLNLEHLRRFPHAFSGGQRQRISIARALVSNPKFIVADESVAALDVSIQADILNLLKQLQNELNLTYLFISHDLSVVAHVCDIVAVMYLGHIVEMAPSRELFSNPRHPYTKALLSSIPSIDPENKSRAIELEGEIPSAMNPPSGCVFRTRCPHASPDGKEGNIEMGLEEVEPDHWVDRCGVSCG